MLPWGPEAPARSLVRSVFLWRVLQGLAQSSGDHSDVARADLAASAVYGASIGGTRTKSRLTNCNCNASKAENRRVAHLKLFSPRIARMRDFI
jgi:hypothetical protein